MLTSLATGVTPKKHTEVITVSLGEVVNEKFFCSLDSALGNTNRKNKYDGYYQLYIYAYADSMFYSIDADKYFNNDSLTWIVVFAPPRIVFSEENYLVTYNQSKYLVNKNIGNQGNLIKPLNKTKRICQEFEFTYYHLFPYLFLWHPSGKIDRISEDTMLYYNVTE